MRFHVSSKQFRLYHIQICRNLVGIFYELILLRKIVHHWKFEITILVFYCFNSFFEKKKKKEISLISFSFTTNISVYSFTIIPTTRSIMWKALLCSKRSHISRRRLCHFCSRNQNRGKRIVINLDRTQFVTSEYNYPSKSHKVCWTTSVENLIVCFTTKWRSISSMPWRIVAKNLNRTFGKRMQPTPTKIITLLWRQLFYSRRGEYFTWSKHKMWNIYNIFVSHSFHFLILFFFIYLLNPFRLLIYQTTLVQSKINFFKKQHEFRRLYWSNKWFEYFLLLI